MYNHLQAWEKPEPFDETDLEELVAKVKHMGIVNGALAESFLLKGLRDITKYPELAAFYFERAVRHYEEALDANPTNLSYMKHCAHALERVLRVHEISEKKIKGHPVTVYSFANPIVLKIATLMKRTLALDPQCPYTLRQYGKLLDKCNELNMAQEQYLRALEADISYYEAYSDYSAMLKCWGGISSRSAERQQGKELEEMGLKLDCYWSDVKNLCLVLVDLGMPEAELRNLGGPENNASSSNI